MRNRIISKNGSFLILFSKNFVRIDIIIFIGNLSKFDKLFEAFSIRWKEVI